MNTTRRRTLQSVGAIAGFALAGCSSPGQSEGQTRLTIRTNNQSGTSQTFSVSVTDSDGEVVVERPDVTVPDGVSQAVEETGLDGDSYTIRVTGDRWATSGVWQPDTCRDYTFLTTLDSPETTPAVTARASCSTDQ